MRIADDASYLWVNSISRAISFLAAAGLVIAALALFEWRGTQFVFRYMEPARPEKLEWVRLPFQLAKAGTMDADLVILIGGSTSRELPPSDQFMSRALSQSCGRAIRFVNAGSSSQGFPEEWAATNALPRERIVLIVVGLNNQRFEDGLDQTRRAFNGLRMPFGGPPELRAILTREGAAPARTFPSLGTTGWLVKRSAKWRFSPPISYEQFVSKSAQGDFQTESNVYAAPIQTQQKKRAAVSRMISEQFPVYLEVHEESTRLWVEFVHEFRGPGRNVLFLNLPGSEALTRLERLARPHYERDVKSLLASGARFEPLQGANLLSEEDFYDQQHLIESGRRKIAPALVAQLASAIPSCHV